MKDRGPWYVQDTGTKVYIESDDFTHDVSLRVIGDFANIREKRKYAKEIAGVLNAACLKEGQKCK